jgi:hypothetical protein
MHRRIAMAAWIVRNVRNVRQVRIVRIGTALAALFLWGAAHAAIYTWTDSTGRTNFSNVEPPPGAKVLAVVDDRPAPPLGPDAEQDARDARVRALAERVHQLEADLQRARQRDAAAVAPVALSPSPAPARCDSTAYDCGDASGAPYFYSGYPASIVFVQPPYHRDRWPRQQIPFRSIAPSGGLPSTLIRR